ncbi:solute carrier family 35 member F2-like isoform X2 [Pomacea canaliculata]|uniref:solute carrier family 35 member F2-like isoform X2 n=1 Tax=Pomacea canaliculata TaxID=400727 RepID=UPI000D72877B|nr:solute carrier family 35 member F2-like isoform X2 [Pomacea canaliculata]
MSSYEHIGPDWDEEDEQSHGQHELKQRWGLICIKEFTGCILRCIRVLCSRKFLKALLYGQLVSLLLSGTAVFSGLLQQQGVNTPAGQNFLNYCLLCLVYTVMLACRPGDERRRTLGTMLRYDGWKYALLALVDFEANYLVVKAYQFTTITSVQLLNCLTILVVVVLSRIFLKTRYTAVHMAGIVISVVGLGGLVLADLLSGRNTDDPGGSKKWLGDVLVVCGAILYGMSNVGQEFVVKKFPRSDFLGMISLFGSFISGLQFILLEKDEFATVTLSYKIFSRPIHRGICSCHKWNSRIR